MIFGKDFSNVYELLYQDKNYILECEMIESICKSNLNYKAESWVDFGCGTGQHLLRLAGSFSHLYGVDRSEAMISKAKTKPHAQKIHWQVGDLKNTLLPKRDFDLATSLFAVLSFIYEDEGVLNALKNIRAHLKKGALFVADVWHAKAVLKQKLENRVKVIQHPEFKIIKEAFPHIDLLKRTNEIKQVIKIYDPQTNNLLNEVIETQKVRFFDKDEMDVFLNQSGFQSLKFFSFPDAQQTLSEDYWDMGILARAI